MVLAVILMPVVGPGSPIASAGWDCKDVPSPEFPNAATETTFDSSSADREPIKTEDGKPGPTGYQTFGWAGLKWYTYDLGCGPDLTRAPDAVADTKLGNVFLTIGKSMAAAAFWLDGQTKTGQEATAAGVQSALGKFDNIINSIVKSMFGIYGLWLGIGLAVVSAIILWRALRADMSGVTRAAGVAAAGLALGAFMVGAPQKAIDVADNTFGTLITDTQDQIFSMSFGEGGEAGTLNGGQTDPRNVLIDKIFLDDWRKGWFGANYDDSTNMLGPTLREALAFKYDEQREVGEDPDAQNELAEKKADQFREVVDKLGSNNLSYHQFQGKDSGRTGIGFLAMVKLSMPSLLWIGASILKLTAMLSIRFAILFAAVWVPLAIAHGGLLFRVLRMLASAYMWGVAGAIIVALYLMVLVQVYITDDGSLDGAWRLWLMVLLTAICWLIMRPFKRMSQTLTQNHASILNRKARGAQRSARQKLFSAAATAAGGPVAAARFGAKVGDKVGSRAKGGDSEDGGDESTPVERPEGRGLDNRRRKQAAEAQAVERKKLAIQQSRAALTQRGQEERDARIAGIAARASTDAARGKGNVATADAERAGTAGAAAWRRLDQEEAETQKQEGRARKALATASVGQRWDGGTDAAIAPMKVYSPAPRKADSDPFAEATAKALATASSSRKPPPPPAAAAAVLMRPTAPVKSKPSDRYA